MRKLCLRPRPPGDANRRTVSVGKRAYLPRKTQAAVAAASPLRAIRGRLSRLLAGRGGGSFHYGRSDLSARRVPSSVADHLLRDLAARIGKSLVGYFPRAVAESSHSKKIHEGGGLPASIFSNHRHSGVADPGDRDDARPVASA